MKSLLELAVTKVHLKCNENWYCQKDRQTKDASLAVILPNLWMKSLEPLFKIQTPKGNTNAQLTTSHNCEHRATARSKIVENATCNRWFHAKCQPISNTEYDSMDNQFWLCSLCRENDMTDINHSSQTIFFFGYFVDDIMRTGRSDTNERLVAVNNLHPNLEFALKNNDDKKQFAFSGHVR